MSQIQTTPASSPTYTPATPQPTDWPNTLLIEQGGRRIYLIGTAHVSPKSVEEVASVIDTLKPDTVCVELCQTRFDALMDESRWKKLDIFQVLKQKKAMFLMANLHPDMIFAVIMRSRHG